jgi:Zn ribbon nucleic-acid-binding protein
MSNQITTKASLSCPKCHKLQTVGMSTDACQHFYKCQGCGGMLKPKEGDCCVFCSFADTKCPPKQLEQEFLTNETTS